MTELELLKIIGHAQDVHILDANEMPAKRKTIFFPKPLIRTIAAVLAVVLAVSLFLQTPMGAAAAEVVKAQIDRFLDILFPPKDMQVYVEGMPETVHVEAQGREPEADNPGFSIYVDSENYTMTEEDGSWFIRPIDQNPELPPIEMQITEIADKRPIEMAEEIKAQMEGNWETISDIGGFQLDNSAEALSINASKGMEWDAVQEDHQFIDNLQGGSYHVIIRYFMEASEGAGFRLHNMLGSFTIIAPQDPSQYSEKYDALRSAMQQEVAYAQELDAQYEDTILNAASQADMNVASSDRSALWQDVHSKLWTALEQSLDPNAFQNLMAEELDWAAEKQLVLDGIIEELGGGSLTGTVLNGENTLRTKERVLVLLSYLEGTAAPPQRKTDVTFSPRPVVDSFTAAYFRGDSQTTDSHLSARYSGDHEISYTGTEIIHSVKGLDNVIQDMANRGHLKASVEFRPAPDSDWYNYLSMTLVWEENRWVVESYGLEG